MSVDRAFDVLLDEKDKVFQEKITVISGLKRSVGLSVVVLSLAFGTAYEYNIDLLFLLIPFLVSIVLHYLRSGIMALTMQSSFIVRLDNEIAESLGKDIPSWEVDVGARLHSQAGPWLQRFISSYIQIAINVAPIVAGLYIYSAYRGAVLISGVSFLPGENVVFVVIYIGACILPLVA